MTFFDYFVIACLGVSALISLFRGFFKEVVSLVSWLIAIWAAFTFAGALAPKIVPFIPFVNDLPVTKSLIVQNLISGGVIFFSILLLGALANFILSLMVEKTGLTGSDRFLGMLFGAARGALIVALLTMFLGSSATVQQEIWWQNSKLRPQAQAAAAFLENITPDKYKKHLPGQDEIPGESKPAPPDPVQQNSQDPDATSPDLTDEQSPEADSEASNELDATPE
ncbi:MAG: CvpA family protein [Gammaproteobacteria bacterium]|nr:CvpA family protein [Gammaproteobacteria bacterium]NNC96951.1 CvpA family protein [Gammaproteobacteria bacterium]NNM14579.1 CvpA family protein [Gammaproteobacteria bacterium]